MSTAELKRYIDERTEEERAWIVGYVAWLQRPRKVRDATPEEIERLAPRVEAMATRRQHLTEEEYFSQLEAPKPRARRVR